ncbi:glyoxylate reductase [Malassezia brasiliensis]|uniref:Glyoxylate reductase n=1 Tax=Malassezia brasiliensis TaxID=1821822 RepID=A0AAF0IQZ6_9BASI|nr:glyoxylate reductase [Malassezia brasiliensis]
MFVRAAPCIARRAQIWTLPVRALATSARPKVLLLDEIQLATKDLDRLAQTADVLRNDAQSRDEFLEAVSPGGKYSDIRGLYRHFGGARSVRITGRFDQELVDKLPDTLKFIVHNGAGYDQLDIPALTSKGIQAANVPTVVNEASADTALFLLIGAMRRFPLALAHLRAGSFNQQFPFRSAADPEGQVLGIVGAGGIGQTLAKKAAHALGMRVLYHNRRKLSDEQETAGMPSGTRMTYCASLDELLTQSDAVSLNCPLTPETRHLISDAQFAKMKRTAVLINTARGPVVDEEALVRALEQETIAGAGLDVYEHEPKVGEALRALGETRAMLLPHVGTLSLQTQTAMEAACINNLLHGLATGKLQYTVREQEGIAF